MTNTIIKHTGQVPVNTWPIDHYHQSILTCNIVTSTPATSQYVTNAVITHKTETGRHDSIPFHAEDYNTVILARDGSQTVPSPGLVFERRDWRTLDVLPL